MFKCDYCEYESTSKKVVNIQKDLMHKQEKAIASNILYCINLKHSKCIFEGYHPLF